MPDPDKTGGAFKIDEEPLRQWILKAHHSNPKREDASGRVLDAIRHFLSGPIGGLSSPRYWFHDRSDVALSDFAAELYEAHPELLSVTLEPLLQGIESGGEASANSGDGDESSPELAPNLSVYVAFLAGPIALKTSLDETVVCALVSTILLALAKLGRDEVARIIEGRSQE